MTRERIRKVVLIIFGLLFVAAIYPIAMYLKQPGNQPPGDTMMMSLYLTLGVFLLIASANPPAYRSLIAYSGWANIAHGTVMLAMALRIPADSHDFLVAAAVAIAIGIALLAVVPPKPARPSGPEATA